MSFLPNTLNCVPSGHLASRSTRLHAPAAHRRGWIIPQWSHTRSALDAGSIAFAADLPSTSTAQRETAWELLKDFTLKEFRGAAQEPYLSSPAKRQRLRAALKIAFSGPYPPAGWMGPSADSEVLLGIVASDVKFAARAYRDWCEELGLPLVMPNSRVGNWPSAGGNGTTVDTGKRDGEKAQHIECSEAYKTTPGGVQ